MILAKIVGTVVATRKDERLVSNKLLIVRPVDPSGKADANYLVAVDTVDAGFGETVMEFRASIMHGSVFTCWGELGGVAHGTFTKSKNSVMSGCAASRAVKLGKLNRVSMNFKMAV